MSGTLAQRDAIMVAKRATLAAKEAYEKAVTIIYYAQMDSHVKMCGDKGYHCGYWGCEDCNYKKYGLTDIWRWDE